MCVDVQASPFSVYYHCFLRCVDVQASVTAVEYNKEVHVLSWMMLIIFVYKKRGYITMYAPLSLSAATARPTSLNSWLLRSLRWQMVLAEGDPRQECRATAY